MPPPHVDSAVVRIERVESGLDADGLAATSAVIDAAFAQRRKTIRNSMAAGGYAKDELDRAFAEAAIDPGARAEALDVADFIRLARVLGGPRPGRA